MGIVSGMLLPLGVWLILSAGTPGQLHRKLATASLIAIAVAVLSFVAFGFALMFGGVGLAQSAPESSFLNSALSVGQPERPWIFAGVTGFFLIGAMNTQGLTLFVQYLPLVIVCALLVTGGIGVQARMQAHIMVTTVIAGIVLPIVGSWTWGEGWLASLGLNANLGNGFLDVGHLSTVGIVAGVAGVAWFAQTPRRERSTQPELPAAHFPVRTVASVLCILASSFVFATTQSSGLALAQFVNSSIAVSVAIVTAGFYTVFTTRSADILSASRAAIAAVFITSSGGAALPLAMIVILGVVCGLLATVGYYAVNETLRWQDDSALLTAVFAPAALGLFMPGVFTTDAFGLAARASQNTSSGVGQLAAQFTGLVAIALFTGMVSSALIALARRLHVSLLPSPELNDSQPPTASPAAALTVLTTPGKTTPLAEVGATYHSQPSVISGSARPETLKGGAFISTNNDDVSVPVKKKGLLGWLRRSSADPYTPKQPRKVAYPYRVGGRRITRHPAARDVGDAGDSLSRPTQDNSA